MADPHDTIEEAIDAIAKGGIKSASEESRALEHLSIEDLIKAADYQAGKGASKKPSFGLRITRQVPPGAG